MRLLRAAIAGAALAAQCLAVAPFEVVPACPFPGVDALTVVVHPEGVGFPLDERDRIAIVPLTVTDCTADALAACTALGTCSAPSEQVLAAYGNLRWGPKVLPGLAEETVYNVCYQRLGTGAWTMLSEQFSTCESPTAGVVPACPYPTASSVVFTVSPGSRAALSTADFLSVVAVGDTSCATACAVGSPCASSSNLALDLNGTLEWAAGELFSLDPQTAYSLCYKGSADNDWSFLSSANFTTCAYPTVRTTPGCFSAADDVALRVDMGSLSADAADTLAVVPSTVTDCAAEAASACAALSACSDGAGVLTTAPEGLTWALPSGALGALADGADYAVCLHHAASGWYRLEGEFALCRRPAVTMAPDCPYPGIDEVVITLSPTAATPPLTVRDKLAFVPGTAPDCAVEALPACTPLGTCSNASDLTINAGVLTWTLALPGSVVGDVPYRVCHWSYIGGTWSALDERFTPCTPPSYTEAGSCPFKGELELTVTPGTEALAVGDLIAVVRPETADCVTGAVPTCTALQACSVPAEETLLADGTLAWAPSAATLLEGNHAYKVCYRRAGTTRWVMLQEFVTCAALVPPIYTSTPGCPIPGIDSVSVDVNPGTNTLSTDDTIAVVPDTVTDCAAEAAAACAALGSCSVQTQLTIDPSSKYLQWRPGALPGLIPDRSYKVCFMYSAESMWFELAGSISTCVDPMSPTYTATPDCPTPGVDAVAVTLTPGTTPLRTDDVLALVPANVADCTASAWSACSAVNGCSGPVDMALDTTTGVLTWTPQVPPTLEAGVEYGLCYRAARTGAWEKLAGTAISPCRTAEVAMTPDCPLPQADTIAFSLTAGSLQFNANDALAVVPARASGCDNAASLCAALQTCSTAGQLLVQDGGAKLQWIPGPLRRLRDLTEYKLCIRSAATNRWAPAGETWATCAAVMPPDFRFAPACPIPWVTPALNVTIRPGRTAGSEPLAAGDEIAVVHDGVEDCATARADCAELGACSETDGDVVLQGEDIVWTVTPFIFLEERTAYRVCFRSAALGAWSLLPGRFRTCSPPDPDPGPRLPPALATEPACPIPGVDAVTITVQRDGGGARLSEADRLVLLPRGAVECTAAAVVAACKADNPEAACSLPGELQMAGQGGSVLTWRPKGERRTLPKLAADATYNVCYWFVGSGAGGWVAVNAVRTCAPEEAFDPNGGVQGPVKEQLEESGKILTGLGLGAGAGAGKNAILRNIGCDVDDVDLGFDSELDLEFHPTGLTLTSTPSRYLIGCVVSNIAGIILLSGLCLGTADVVAALRDTASVETRPRAQLPGFFMIPFMFLLPGTSLAACRLLFFPGTSGGWAALGFFGLAAVSGYICWTYMTCLRRIPTHAKYCIDPRLRRPGDEAMDADDQPIKVHTGAMRRVYTIFFGSHIWVSGQIDPWFSERFGLAFDSMREGHTNFVLIEQVSMMSLALLSVWKPDGTAQCHVRNGMITLQQFAFLMYILLHRPWTSTLDNVIGGLLAAMTFVAILEISIAIAIEAGEHHFLHDSAGWLLLVSAWMLIMKAIYDIVRYLVDLCIGRRAAARQQARETAGLQKAEFQEPPAVLMSADLFVHCADRGGSSSRSLRSSSAPLTTPRTPAAAFAKNPLLDSVNSKWGTDHPSQKCNSPGFFPRSPTTGRSERAFSTVSNAPFQISGAGSLSGRRHSGRQAEGAYQHQPLLQEDRLYTRDCSRRPSPRARPAGQQRLAF